ncbi:MAG: NRDE family protein [Bacteroidia bacterium]
MCTVSFLPKGGNDFILTSNRDEKENREIAQHPKEFNHQHLKVVYPQDPRAKGTWIAMSENGFSLCLLNGGFVYHKSKPPYRKSRGVVLLDFFQFNNVNQFVVNYDFKKIEPFTLIIVDYKSSLKLYEVRWDGKQAHLSYKDPKSTHIWSSVTLYSPDVRAEREQWFEDWKKTQTNGFESNTIKEFHFTGGKGEKETDLMMRRAGTFTVSITQIVKEGHRVEMNYTDCIKKINSDVSLPIT